MFPLGVRLLKVFLVLLFLINRLLKDPLILFVLKFLMFMKFLRFPKFRRRQNVLFLEEHLSSEFMMKPVLFLTVPKI